MRPSVWALGLDGIARPVRRRPRVTCQLCDRRVLLRSTWPVPAGSGERYCRVHFSTDDARLRHEFEEAAQ